MLQPAVTTSTVANTHLWLLGAYFIALTCTGSTSLVLGFTFASIKPKSSDARKLSASMDSIRSILMHSVARHFPEITQFCMVIVSKGNQVAVYVHHPW